MSTIEILLTIGVVTFIIYTVCTIVFFVEFFRVSFALRRFIQQTEQRLGPILTSLTGILDDIGKTTQSVAAFTGIQKIAGSLASVEKVVRIVYESLRGNVGETARANIAGLKAGIKTGVISILNNMRDKKEDHHEGSTG